jgi:UDP-N-acetylglucosamine 2-epimerase
MSKIFNNHRNNLGKITGGKYVIKRRTQKNKIIPRQWNAYTNYLLVHLKLKMEDSGSVIRNQAVISYAAKTKDTFTKSPWTSIAKQRW